MKVSGLRSSSVALLYAGLGITTILVLRGMSRRARARDGFEETDSPYGPREIGR